MLVEGFIGDSKEYLICQTEKLSKKLRKSNTYTQCIISEVQTANDWTL